MAGTPLLPLLPGYPEPREQGAGSGVDRTCMPCILTTDERMTDMLTERGETNKLLLGREKACYCPWLNGNQRGGPMVVLRLCRGQHERRLQFLRHTHTHKLTATISGGREREGEENTRGCHAGEVYVVCHLI